MSDRDLSEHGHLLGVVGRAEEFIVAVVFREPHDGRGSAREGLLESYLLNILRHDIIVLTMIVAAKGGKIHLTLVDAYLSRIVSRAVEETRVGGQIHISARFVVVEYVVEHLLLTRKEICGVVVVFHPLDVFRADLLDFACAHLSVFDVERHTCHVGRRHGAFHWIHVDHGNAESEEQVDSIVTGVALSLVGQVRGLVAVGDSVVTLHRHLC